MMTRNPLDKKDLMYEAYRIEGIDSGECRSIFLDWAMSLPDGQNTQEAIAHFLGVYQADFPDHPMTEVLKQGQEAAEPARRRGGWQSRPRD